MGSQVGLLGASLRLLRGLLGALGVSWERLVGSWPILWHLEASSNEKGLLVAAHGGAGMPGTVGYVRVSLFVLSCVLVVFPVARKSSLTVVNVSLCPIGSWSISRESVVLRLGTQPPLLSQ